MVCTPWLPPGGSCHDEISASRNRYFVVTDEGWRWLKVSDFHVGWRKPGHIPSIQLHSLTNLSPPLISQSCRFRSAVKPGSFPPGEAKNSEDFGDDHSTNCSIAGAAGRQVGDPYGRIRLSRCSHICNSYNRPAQPSRLPPHPPWGQAARTAA